MCTLACFNLEVGVILCYIGEVYIPPLYSNYPVGILLMDLIRVYIPNEIHHVSALELERLI